MESTVQTKKSHNGTTKKIPSNKSKVRVVGDGRFVQRVRKPQAQGKKVKSLMLRVDADFAALCRKRAETEGSVTEVTRKIYHMLNGGGAS